MNSWLYVSQSDKRTLQFIMVKSCFPWWPLASIMHLEASYEDSLYTESYHGHIKSSTCVFSAQSLSCV